MEHDVEVQLGVRRYRVDVDLGDLATKDHAVERGRQQLLEERPELESFHFHKGRVVE